MGPTINIEQLHVNIRLRGEILKPVCSFKNLGSLVNEDGRCDAYIKTSIGMAKAAKFIRISHILRKRLVEECHLGVVEGRTARVRQRTRFLDGSKEVVGCDTIVGVPQLAED